MRAVPSIRFAAALLTGLVMGGSALAADFSQQADWAESLIKNVAAANNTYGGSSTIVTWAGVNGATIYQNQSTCAPFVTNVVKTANNLSNTDYKARTGSTSPSSAQYYDLIVGQTGFTRIAKAADIRRGDIVALKYLPCADNASTGHTMMALGAPVLRAATKPFIAGTVQYEVKIADSTSSPHTATDSAGITYTDLRNSSTNSGAGIGTLRLYADETTGVIAGYSWTVGSGSVYYDANSCRLIAAGRMQ